MTVTDERATAAPLDGEHRGGPVAWVTTTDHKKIGLMYCVTAFTYFLVGGALAGAIRAELAETGTQLRLGRSGYEARLARWDALRAALGERADRLAVVHLDHESKPDRRDRVVARFANERDEAVLLAAAASEAETDQADPHAVAEATEPARSSVRPAKRRNRIPRYE